MVGLGASFALFTAIRAFSKGSPSTMNKEYQEATNEYLKVRLSTLSLRLRLEVFGSCCGDLRFWVACRGQRHEANTVATLGRSCVWMKSRIEKRRFTNILNFNRHKTPNPSPVSHPKGTPAPAKSKAHLRRSNQRILQISLLRSSFLLPSISFVTVLKRGGMCIYWR